ncbi:uncharacterized protein BKA78DRAFT_305175 [Phyllosticta capitalensis]|uniref:uncharacterized protein n=1 Tax=Phyllosticta capitalensis TaxID=121624 RepID=UPI00313008B0
MWRGQFWYPEELGPTEQVKGAHFLRQHRDTTHINRHSVNVAAAAMPAIRGADSKKKTRRYARDVDQVYADLRSERHLQQFQETKAKEDLPGLGEFYCKECAKWFESDANLVAHRKAKPHKRRYVQLFLSFEVEVQNPDLSLQTAPVEGGALHAKGGRGGRRPAYRQRTSRWLQARQHRAVKRRRRHDG